MPAKYAHINLTLPKSVQAAAVAVEDKYLTPQYLVPLDMDNTLASMVRSGCYRCTNPAHIEALTKCGLLKTDYAVLTGAGIELTESGKMMAIEIYKAKKRRGWEHHPLTLEELVTSIIQSRGNGTYGQI